jgi:hypothetical protein
MTADDLSVVLTSPWCNTSLKLTNEIPIKLIESHILILFCISRCLSYQSADSFPEDSAEVFDIGSLYITRVRTSIDYSFLFVNIPFSLIFMS